MDDLRTSCVTRLSGNKDYEWDIYIDIDDGAGLRAYVASVVISVKKIMIGILISMCVVMLIFCQWTEAFIPCRRGRLRAYVASVEMKIMIVILIWILMMVRPSS